MFYISAAFFFGSTILFLLLAKGEVLPWAKVKLEAETPEKPASEVETYEQDVELENSGEFEIYKF